MNPAPLPLPHPRAPRDSAPFKPEEFLTRRGRVLERIGGGAVAVLQGAATPPGFDAFRQTNEFHYLCGIETPHAWQKWSSMSVSGRFRLMLRL